MSTAHVSSLKALMSHHQFLLKTHIESKLMVLTLYIWLLRKINKFESHLNFYSNLLQVKIDFLKWYLSVKSSEIYGKLRVFRPKKIKKINFYLYNDYLEVDIQNVHDFLDAISSWLIKYFPVKSLINFLKTFFENVSSIA
jgi:hypothetical protein